MVVELEVGTSSAHKQVRPPTPPRESAEHATPLPLSRVVESARRILRGTSSLTPQSSLEVANTPTTSSRKRVIWADLAEHSDVPNHSVEGSSLFSSPAAPLPPSVERRALKSILKSVPRNDVSLTIDDSPFVTSFAKMLESTIQQLEGGDRSAKVDAYVTLSRAMKATENLPDIRALRTRMDKLISYIKRDLSAGEDSTPETSLALNALILLCSFFHNPLILELLPADFSLWIVDYSIRTLDDPQSAKDVARYLMFILAKQSFPVQIMSKDRVSKIINVLHTMPKGNLTGKRIIDGRTNIYRTLIRQSKSYMLANPTWLEDLFTDMTSKYKDSRSNAIAFGLEAAFLLGNEPKITREVSALFATDIGEKGKYGGLYIERLRQLSKTDVAKDPTAPSAVPQIWSVLIMLFRSRLQSLERWEFLTPWLKIISNAFNGSDIPARKEALLAWNRFIFVLHSSETIPPTSPASSLVKLLPHALEVQLRRGSMRVQALNTLCCLLYFSLKSTSTQEQLVSSWNDYVARLVGKCLTPTDLTSNPIKARLLLSEACTIICGLFEVEAKRDWNAPKILENNFPADELNPLDPKWIRKHAAIVFPIVGSLLEKQYWDLGSPSHASKLWQVYTTCIASPAAKEIKVSNDTMVSVAIIFGFLHKIWRSGPSDIDALSNNQIVEASDAFINSFGMLVTTLIRHLGILPFTDRQLCLGTQDTFISIATPSQKPSKIKGQAGTPLYHLTRLLSSISPNLEYNDSFANWVRKILDPFFLTRKTKPGIIELARSILDMLPSENTEPIRIFWHVIATITADTIGSPDTDIITRHGQPLGTVYKDLVKILEYGVTLARNETAVYWNVLYRAVAESVVAEAGDSGKALALIEPLTASFLRTESLFTPLSRVLHFCEIVDSVAYPRDRHALDAATKKLWGTVGLGQRPSNHDPYNRQYDYTRSSLEIAYSGFFITHTDHYGDMLDSTTSLIKRCSPDLSAGLLSRISQGVGVWIQNTHTNFSSGSRLAASVMDLWTAICSSLKKTSHNVDHTELLVTFEKLLCCAFESKQKNVVNTAIDFWNEVFGDSMQEVQYPEQLQNVLLRLRSVADLHLPSLPASVLSQYTTANRQPLEFEESQFDFGSTFNLSELSPMPQSRPLGLPTSRMQADSPHIGARNFKRSREATPEGRESVKKRATTPRLRHADSQVQFQPIDSSPTVDRVVDSQMLTDRQKEVRERQIADGVFQYLGSSPRRRRGSANESDQELPAPRSSSSSSRLRINTRERQSTPVLVIPSDDYDEFVASSPTPTRSIKSGVEDEVPGSSPPQPPVIDMDLEDIPSSPIEYLNTQDMNDAVLDPSAQLDPHIEERPTVVSTYGSTVDLTDLMDAQNMTIPHSAEQAMIGNEMADLGTKEVPLAIAVVADDTTFDENEASQQLHETNSALPKHTDFPVGQTSPASSDVFVDAVSSPPKNTDIPIAKPTSSDFTDLDESSIMRALAEADEVRSPPHRPDTAVRSQSVHLSPSRFTPQVVLSKTLPGHFMRRTSTPRRTQGHLFAHLLSTPFRGSSPPAHGSTALALSQELFENDPSLTEENTIIFNNPDLWEEEEEVTTPSGRRFKTTKALPPVAGRKRKLQFLEEEEAAHSPQSIHEGSFQSTSSASKRGRGRPRKSGGTGTGESQESVLEISSQVSMTSTKKVRGRPRKSPRQSQEIITIPDEVEELVEGVDDMSGSSHDVEMLDSEIPETSSIEPANKATQVEEGLSDGANQVLGSSDSVSIVPETVRKEQTHGPARAVGETQDVFETSREEITASVPGDDSAPDAEIPSPEVIEETRIFSETKPAETPTPKLTTPPPQPPATPKSSFSIIGTLKDQLHALMNTLRGGSLTRTETTEVEDGLMDVKEALYGAARRGRNKVEKE